MDTQTAQLEGQRKQIDVATANVRSARVQLEYCTIHAPFTGVVIAKAAQVGEIVSPFSAGGGFTRTGIGTLVDMDSLEIEVDVNEAYINRVQPKQPVDSVLNAYPDWKIPSHVIAIIPTADRSKATVKVRIGIDNKDDRIVPDMGVRVSFLEEKKPVALTHGRRLACWFRLRPCAARATRTCCLSEGPQSAAAHGHARRRLRQFAPSRVRRESRRGCHRRCAGRTAG